MLCVALGRRGRARPGSGICSRLPRPAQIGVGRLWTQPPQLGVEAKVTLELQNSGAMPVLVQLIEDAPASFRAGTPQLELSVPAGRQSATYAIHHSPRGTRRRALWQCLLALRRASSNCSALGNRAPATNRPRLPQSRRSQAGHDLLDSQPPDRHRKAPRPAARPGPRVRKPPRISRRRRVAGHLLDRHRAPRQAHQQVASHRAQPDRLADYRRWPIASHARPRPEQTRLRRRRRAFSRASRPVLRRSRRDARLRTPDPAAPSRGIRIRTRARSARRIWRR